jgi:hypothetical protein
MSALCRFCCKSHFALLIKKFLGRRRVFRVRMWGSCDLALNSSVTSVIDPGSLLFSLVWVLAEKITAQRLGTFATKSARSGHSSVRFVIFIPSDADYDGRRADWIFERKKLKPRGDYV